METNMLPFAKEIALKKYGIHVTATLLAGDEDINFLLKTETGKKYLLKIASESKGDSNIAFQNSLLLYLATKKLNSSLPESIQNVDGALLSTKTYNDQVFSIRLLSWVSGRLWAKVNPKTKTLRIDLGRKAGELTAALKEFSHPEAERNFDWNLADSAWTVRHTHLFSEGNKQIVEHFQKLFKDFQPLYSELPKSVIHNDLNDYNIVVSEDLKNPAVNGFIDFGDTVKSQTVNEIAILLAYATMEVPDPLAAALDVLQGYHEYYHFSEHELECLYTLIGMRLVTTVTKAALRKSENTQNEYHFISEQSAWEALRKWYTIHPNFAYYSFRQVCGYPAHPLEVSFTKWIAKNQISLATLFPSEIIETVTVLDMSVGSTLLGNLSEYSDPEVSEFKLKQFNKRHPNTILANGYLETRPFYTTDAFKSEGNNGPQYRTVHLGTDFWVGSQTPVHAPFDGVIKIAHHNNYDKDYGPMLILEHTFEENIFYTLYGHLTLSTLEMMHVGKQVKQGDLIAYIGAPHENGNWAPHLHFQVIFDLLGNNENFNGVALPSEKEVWKSICPNPDVVFREDLSAKTEALSEEDMIGYRKEHLGRSLSLSYSQPLHIVRGEGAFLIDSDGRKYLDTANNVNHVGHQHPKVVTAGQRQMAVLTTNTRYLHEEIIAYSKKLLAKLPKELEVLHIVNSGSEANELALRMAKTISGNEDMLAIAVGYHGNTNAAMGVSSYKFDAKGGPGKPETTHILPLPDTYRGRHSGNEGDNRYAEYASELIENLKKSGKGIAGFIGESMISCGGQIVPPKNYFKEVYKAVRDAGGICIADEVQTGFGRMGKTFWAFELFDVVPDIVTMGKPSGNGHPLAVVACTRAVADAFNTGMEFFNTFGGNPVSCAIGRTVLEVIEDENLQDHALEIGQLLKSELQKLQQQFPIIGDVRGEGLFLGFELNTSKKEPLPQHADYLADRMKELGILMSTDGPDYNVLKIKPPMVFSSENAKELIKRLTTVFSEDFMQHYDN
ncbi:aminotransferase class III-fold pyridoxal phosphate-dependent enzyme [Jejudonia soesokkakensis]|uniref:Aminotransferase class III-fold pyridoxal phosphate-dependent enzyme n=1 Tax=Jejudonia soesokkakensis TaxID=1323432 RepID=A0ABW2MSG1_9FLAO